jgi:predicted nucleic acid-binding protein
LHEIPVTAEIHAVLRELLERAPLRGMDAIHLASARWVERQLGSALSFYCSDRKLAAAARATGLAVVDPAER